MIEKRRKRIGIDEDEKPDSHVHLAKRKTNDPDQKDHSAPAKKKRVVILKDIWSVRIALQGLYNELRNNEVENQNAGRQIQCLTAMVDVMRISDVERLLNELKAEIMNARSGMGGRH